MPRPPPPATALISTGKPTSCAKRSASSSLEIDAFAAGHDGNARLPSQVASRVLVAQPRHGLGRRTDEIDLAAAADLVEVGVLGKKPVARMNRLHVADFGGADHAGDLEIAVRRLRRTDAIRLVGQLQVPRAAIALAEDRDRLDAQFSARPDDPQRDFTAVGYENSLVHRIGFRVRGSGFGGLAFVTEP